MIISKTPFRMSFFGGGTDFYTYYKEHGGSVISTTFDKFCIVSVGHLPRFFDYTNQVTYSKVERVKKIDDIEHPAVRNAMKMLDMHELRIDYYADLPARSGLGTSSSFAVGMLNAFYALKGKYASKNKLAEDAIYLERVLCAERGGCQDQIAVAFGGFNRIDFNAAGFQVRPIVMPVERKKELNKNLMMFFTGFSRFSMKIAEEQEKSIANKLQELKEIQSLVDDAEKILTSKCDLSEFGRLLDYTWKLKRGLTKVISNDVIDTYYEKAKKAGAIGGKLLGAGGGGFLTLYVDDEYKTQVREALSECLFIPFEFENEGTKIIYYQEEFYEPDIARD